MLSNGLLCFENGLPKSSFIIIIQQGFYLEDRKFVFRFENGLKLYLQISKIENQFLIASVKPCFSELRCDLWTLKNLLRDGTSSGESASAQAKPHLPRANPHLASPPIELASWQASQPAAMNSMGGFSQPWNLWIEINFHEIQFSNSKIIFHEFHE